LTLTTLAER